MTKLNSVSRDIFIHLFCATTLMFALIFASCGVAPQTDFPNRVVGADGQEFVLEDLEEIANNARLTDDQKRDAFRNLGIADEELIDALLNL